jgi:transketolase
VLGAHIPRIAIEAAHADFWRKYVGLHGAVIGIDRFGESAPAGQLFDLFGFTVANVVSTTKALLS